MGTNTITHNEFRRTIAEQLGWTISHVEYSAVMGFLPCDALGPYVFTATSPGGRTGYSQLSDSNALDNADCPNWPCDVGTALTLCLAWAQPRQYQLMLDWKKDGRFFVAFMAWNQVSTGNDPLTYYTHIDPGWAEGDTPAIALCRLWLAATEKEK